MFCHLVRAAVAPLKTREAFGVGEFGTAPATRSASALRQTPASLRFGPSIPGPTSEVLATLAGVPPHRDAGHGCAVTPRGFSVLLDLKEQASSPGSSADRP